MTHPIDKMLASKNPWVVLGGCTAGSAGVVAVFTARTLRRGDTGPPMTSTTYACIVAGAGVFGFLLGLYILGYRKYSELKSASARPPFHLRVVYDQFVPKLVLLVPVIVILAIVVTI